MEFLSEVTELVGEALRIEAQRLGSLRSLGSRAGRDAGKA